MRRTVLGFLALLLAGVPAYAAGSLKLEVKEHHLDNGLTLLLVERHGIPTVSFNVRFRVGSVDEENGRTGVAHILEHMLFKGTPKLGTRDYAKEKPLLEAMEKAYLELRAESRKGDGADPVRLDALRKEFDALREEAGKYVVAEEDWTTLERNGARGLNAGTGQDSTAYFYSLPKNRIELFHLIESGRMRYPVLREFYTERSVIMEERRMRVDNSPVGTIFEALHATAFSAHPYRWMPIGWMSDISQVARSEVEAFFRKYYAPNQAVVAVVGDFDSAEMLALFEKYWGDIPRQPAPEEPRTVEPPQNGERRAVVTFPAQLQVVVQAWHRPAVGHPDFYALDLINTILHTGRTSRLHTRFVKTRLAQQVFASNQDTRYPHLFFIGAIPLIAPPMVMHTVAECETAIAGELDRLKTEPVPEAELRKAKDTIQAAQVRGLRSNAGLASVLTTAEVNISWRYYETYLDRIEAITAEDIQRVAKTIFRDANRTTIVLRPDFSGTKRAAGTGE